MIYSIGEFSKLINLSIDTIRYYEKEGLIICRRDNKNRRIFDDNDIKWLEFLKKLKLTKMSIKDMKVYAALRYQGDETIQERLELLNKQLEILNIEKEKINTHISFLNDKIIIYNKMLKNND